MVGQFRLRTEVSKNELQVGESATLEIHLSGAGNVLLLSEPPLPELEAVKVYDDKPSGSIDRSGSQLRGSKTYRKALVPLRAGEHQVPALEVVYFDPKVSDYRTARTSPIDLDVRPAEGKEELMLTESVAPTTGKVAVRILADDILPIHRGLDAVSSQRLSGWRGALWTLGWAAPPLAFLAVFLARRRQEQFQLDAGLKRRRSALRRAQTVLDDAQGQLRGGDGGANVQRLSRCLREYIGDKLGAEGTAPDAPGSGRSAALGRRRRRHRTPDPRAAGPARGDAVQRPGAIRGGDRRASRDLDSLSGQGSRPQSGSTRGGVVVRALWFLLSLAVVSVAAAAAPPVESQVVTLPGAETEETEETEDLTVPAVGEGLEIGEVFVNANNAYEEGDYPGALGLYEAVIERGIANGYVFFNLGNAYLRNGELGRAIASYRRALALLPREQDAQANLEFARKSRRDDLAPPSPAPILRTLFFWHYSLSRAELMRVAVLTNLLMWGVAVLLLYRRRSEVLRWLLVGLSVILVASAGSLLVRGVKPRRVAVVIPQEIDARSGTDLNTVVRFKLHAGTEVLATGVREGWIQIELPDGQRGWIESGHAELVGD